MMNLTPKKIVKELDRYIIGQNEAKKSVALALRNRWRRKNVEQPLQDEILPKNILMIGPTGVGKTEIARRIAKLSNSPFVKVEATKFTEVGYVGRDVDSIVRDLTDISINITKEEFRKKVTQKAEKAAEDRLLDALVGNNASKDTREKFRKKLQSSELDTKEVEVDLKDMGPSAGGSFDIPGMPGSQMGVLNISDILGKAMGNKTKTRKLPVTEARELLITEESDKLIDEEKIVKEAIEKVENYGIAFIDEIDKISSRQGSKSGEVNREGVQRDLLPLIEGSSVSTKYGTVKTDHILFIASGAFHMSSPSDLLPELQGRLPIRVELKALTKEDFVRILKEPESSLIKQYEALMQVEGVTLDFKDDAIDEIATIATEVNKNIENIGARRLHTIMEKLLEEVSYNASESSGKKVKIDAKYVKQHLKDISDNTDLSKFIL